MVWPVVTHVDLLVAYLWYPSHLKRINEPDVFEPFEVYVAKGLFSWWLWLFILVKLMFRYTPISDPDAKGYFDLMIKVCCAVLSLKFPCLTSHQSISNVLVEIQCLATVVTNTFMWCRYIQKAKWVNILQNWNQGMNWKLKGILLTVDTHN